MDRERLEYIADALTEQRERHLAREARIREVREQLGAMGFVGEGGAWMEMEYNSNWTVWFPRELATWDEVNRRENVHQPGVWLADAGVSWEDLRTGAAGVPFDDPIAAATWLLIESANHG